MENLIRTEAQSVYCVEGDLTETINKKEGDRLNIEKTISKVTIKQEIHDTKIPYMKINTPDQAADAFNTLEDLKHLDREMFMVLFLNTKNVVTGYSVISIGSLNASIVNPREVMKAAILHNANSIMLGHNHPSGDTTPSNEDLTVTKRLEDSCNIMGIKYLDHIIIGGDDHLSIMKFYNEI